MKLSNSAAWTLAVLSVITGLRSSDAQVVRPGDDSVIEQSACGSSDTFDGGNADACYDDSPDGACRWGGLSCSPTWTVTAEALFLQRRGPAPAVLMFNTANEIQDLNASSFNFDFRPGADVSLAYNINPGNALEVRYLGIDQWHASANAVTTPGDLLQINAAIPLFAFAGTAMNADYTSEFHNFEINGWHRVSDRLALLAGFRYAELDEQFQITLADTVIPFTYDARTWNRLYGFQLGGKAALWDRGGPFTVEGIGKAGICGNAAEQGSTFPIGFTSVPANDSKTTAAFMGEIGLTAAFRLGEHLSLRGGYRLLWMDGVALATDQVAASDFFNNSGIDASGDAFYHGAFAGLQCQW